MQPHPQLPPGETPSHDLNFNCFQLNSFRAESNRQSEQGLPKELQPLLAIPALALRQSRKKASGRAHAEDISTQ